MLKIKRDTWAYLICFITSWLLAFIITEGSSLYVGVMVGLLLFILFEFSALLWNIVGITEMSKEQMFNKTQKARK